MSTSSLGSLSSRAGGHIARNLSTRPTASYGRTAAYRRIAAHIRHYREASIRSRQDGAPKEAERQWAKEEKRQQRQQEEDAKTEGAGEAEGEQARQKKKDDQAAPPPHGNKTPWQVFTETLQAEFKASKEWEESTKQLSGSINDFTQNPNVQRARSAYSKAAEATSTATGKAFLGTAGAIGRGAAWTWQTPVVKGLRAGAGAVGAGVEKVTRPVRQTEAYKSVKETIDDGASQRYGGWMEKEERRKRREEYERKMGRNTQEVFTENPDAGTNVTLHKDAAWKESWRNFRDNSPVMQRIFGLGSTYRESENPLISTARSVSDRIAGFFAENETAQVIKKFREMEPSFRLEPFLNEMRSYILPEVLEAYVQGDIETLKVWLSAAQFQVYSALMQQYTTAGLKSDGKILDIRGVDILSARMLDPGEIPVLVIMCRTQEVHVYRNKKTGELAAGMVDKVQQVTYAIGVTRVPEDVANPETRGWKFIELQKSARDYL
ncbi:TIM44 subunit of mitochondria import inner membrane translocase [Teratosphaeria nubilosa]|uniref:Mitochondrial import inner membrane translocase subunit TIM44 n=1 Tax=Teratosphaeria nubilosa TaxID=161662 RepID=A0A6G1LDY0_9PEZI|nr:TIM44 subunit of mitochondria import inner membrane translocase [Teratosphaeria nubilosa]